MWRVLPQHRISHSRRLVLVKNMQLKTLDYGSSFGLMLWGSESFERYCLCSAATTDERKLQKQLIQSELFPHQRCLLYYFTVQWWFHPQTQRTIRPVSLSIQQVSCQGQVSQVTGAADHLAQLLVPSSVVYQPQSRQPSAPTYELIICIPHWVCYLKLGVHLMFVYHLEPKN